MRRCAIRTVDRNPRVLHLTPTRQPRLEIGAGTGYNACLLAQLAGRADLVTTIDIDPNVTEQAHRALAATGYGDVHVITGDGGLGYPDHAPYDRIIATVSPWATPSSGGSNSLPAGDWSRRCGSLSSQRVESLPRAVGHCLCGTLFLRCASARRGPLAG